MKDGKKPLSQKVTNKPNLTLDDLFGNILNVPADIRKDIEEKGLEYRFIDAQEYHKMGNVHRRGWRVYKMPKSATIETSSEWASGLDPEGIIRRGSLVLAVRPKEQGDQHRQLLADRAARQSGDYQKRKAEELRAAAKQAGFDTKIKEGYEDDGSED